MKLINGLIAVALAATMAQACSGDDGTDTSTGTEGAGGSADQGTGGTDGGDTGTGDTGTGGDDSGTGTDTGTGGTGDTGTDTGSGEGLECGTSGLCSSVNVMGIVDLEACCPETNENKCGVDVSPAAAFIPGLAGTKCMELEQPGELDASCGDEEFANPVGGDPVQMPGCCRETGFCGVMVNLTEVVGTKLNFGCGDPTPFVEGYEAVACGG